MNKKTQKTKPTTTTVTISDSTSKRQAEQALYQSSCALLNKYTDRLKYYEKQDRPAFTTWLNRELNEALTEYRHLRHLVDNMQSRVDDIICYSEWQGISPHEAYKIWVVAEANGTLDILWKEHPRLGEDACDDEDSQEIENENENEDEDEYGKVKKKDLPSRRIKTVYRQIVRILHPDIKGSPTEEEQTTWHEVQDAYAWGDIHRLEKILKGFSHPTTTPNHEPSLAELIEFRTDVQQRVYMTQQKLSSAKLQPSWNFLKIKLSPKKLADLRQELFTELNRDLRKIRETKIDLDEELDSFQRPNLKKHRRNSPFGNPLY